MKDPVSFNWTKHSQKVNKQILKKMISVLLHPAMEMQTQQESSFISFSYLNNYLLKHPHITHV